MFDNTPLVNNRRYAFASIEAVFDGDRTVGFTAINYKHDLDPGIAKGASPKVLGTTLGVEEAEGSFKMYKEEYASFIQKLGQGYKGKYFNIAVTYALTEEDATVHRDDLVNCRIKTDTDDHQQGTDALVVDVAMYVQTVIRDGISPV